MVEEGRRYLARRSDREQARRDRRRTKSMSVAAQPSTPPPSGRRSSSGDPTDDAEPQALVVTSWFDAGTDGTPYTATVRLTGRRLGVRGTPKARDSFTHDEVVEDVVPGGGRVSVTSWIYELQAGEWTVDARLSRPREASGGRPSKPWERVSTETLTGGAWSWRRWSMSDAAPTPIRTRWAILAPLARIPAVIPGSFTALGLLGIAVALVVMAALAPYRGLAVGPSVAVFLVALLAGLAGAKAWSRVLHPGERLLVAGWAVDGFLVVAPLAAGVTLIGFNLPIGPFLDVVAPGIFFAVAIGRIGCFFTGCCAGRCTRSRFGVWSSDRRIGARRVPTQLLESAAGLLIGTVALGLVVADVVAVDGGVFLAAVATYFVARQLLLRLRAESRQYLWQRSRPSAPTRAQA